MRISVISPENGQGTTTVSLLLADALSRVGGLQVVLTHSNHEDTGMCTYMNLDEIIDPTRSLNIVLSLLQSGAIGGDQLIDYSIPVGDRLNVIDTKSSKLSKDDSGRILNYVLSSLDRILGIIDMGNCMQDMKIVEKIYDDSDYVVCVISPNERVLSSLAEMIRDPEYNYIFKSSKMLYVMNGFNPLLGNLRMFSKRLGIAHQYFYKLEYNPFIQKFCNERNATRVMDLVEMKHFSVLDINEDLRKCCVVISTGLDLGVKWRF